MNEKFENREKEEKRYEIKEGIVAISENMGCLINSFEVDIFDGRSDACDQLGGEFEVTSKSGYFSCAEVYGNFSNHDRFYIHATDAMMLENLIQKIIATKQANGEEIKIDSLFVKSNFTKSEKDGYVKKAKKSMRKLLEQ